MVNQMAIDLSPRWDEFAVYLPAIQEWYSKNVHSDSNRDKSRPFPSGIKLTDLDYLNPKSKLWHYKYGLYSAGQFKKHAPIECSVALRDRSLDANGVSKTIILGDSGGYQIGIGSFSGTEHLKKIKDPIAMCEAWRSCGDVRDRVVDWLCATSDYAMTIDMPLWVLVSKESTSPFKICSREQLTQLTLENLEHIKQNKSGSTKWLNVIQGTNEEDTEYWWSRVKKYKFDGWALAGSVGWRGGLDSVMYNVLRMRDDGAFEDGQDWMHVLGVSQPTWAVMLTAIQLSLREKCNPKLRISYDSASPFQTVGKARKLIRYPKLTKDMKSWVMTSQPSPLSSSYADGGRQFHFPFQSPIGDLLNLDHLNVKHGAFQNRPTDLISDLLLMNHTLYVYVRAFLEANEMVFMRPSEASVYAPPEIMDGVEIIHDLITSNTWMKKYKKHKDYLNQISAKMSKVKKESDIAEDEIR
jgi:hypothetical protein